MMSMMQMLLGRVQAMEVREAKRLAPRLHNIVAQILLHACGRQQFSTSTCNWWSTQLGVSHEGVQQVASSMGTSAGQVVAQADHLLTRRNKYTHPVSLQELDEEVADLQSCITPDLERLCRWECKFLLASRTAAGGHPKGAPPPLETSLQIG